MTGSPPIISCSWPWEPLGVIAHLAFRCDSHCTAVSGPARIVAIQARRQALRFQVTEHPLADFRIVIGNFRHDEPFFGTRTHPFPRRKPPQRVQRAGPSLHRKQPVLVLAVRPMVTGKTDDGSRSGPTHSGHRGERRAACDHRRMVSLMSVTSGRSPSSPSCAFAGHTGTACAAHLNMPSFIRVVFAHPTDTEEDWAVLFRHRLSGVFSSCRMRSSANWRSASNRN